MEDAPGIGSLPNSLVSGAPGSGTDPPETPGRGKRAEDDDLWKGAAVTVRRILDSLPVAVAFVDDQSNFAFINATYASWFGFDEGSVLGRPVREVLGPVAWERLEPHVDRALQGEPQRFEVALRSHAGRKFHLRVQYIPNIEPGVAQSGYFALIQDQTDEQARSAEFAWNGQLLHEALSSARMMAWEWNTRATATTRTANASEVMGFVPESSDFSIADFMDPEDARVAAAALSDAISDVKPYRMQFRLQRPDTNEWRWLETRATPQREPDGTIIVRGLIADVTESHELDLNLRSNQERLRIAQSVALFGTWEWDFTTDVVYCSAEFAALIGLPAEEAWLPPQRFLLQVVPEDRAGLEESLNALCVGREHEYDYRVAGSDGAVRWLASRGKSFPNEHGEPARAVGVAMDVTERKSEQLARERMLEELTRANNAKDQLLGMVSHELRTPLTTLRGNSNILRRRWGALDEDVAMEALSDVERSSQRLQEIVENMLSLAHAENLRPDDLEPLLLRRVLPPVLAEQSTLYPHLSIAVAMPAELLPILGNEGYLRQVLENLLSNAAKYGGGEIQIELERVADEAVVTVVDRGRGIPPGDAVRVFDAFFRSPSPPSTTSGVGLGLTVCKRLVELQGGRIWYEPRPGGGSIFRFSLPIADLL